MRRACYRQPPTALRVGQMGQVGQAGQVGQVGQGEGHVGQVGQGEGQGKSQGSNHLALPRVVREEGLPKASAS